MISMIMRKEFTELRRDGRFTSVLAIIGLLLALAIITGLSTENARHETVAAARSDDAETFLAQGEKNPHTAAHFSRMAHRPVSPLSTFDPGVSAYMGQVIWLEGHYRNPAMFRAAEDAPDLNRLEHFSVAGILTLALPLLVIIMAYGSIATERERGTLRQLLGAGVGLPQLVTGKFIVIAGVALSLLALTVTLSSGFSFLLLADSGLSFTDMVLRSLALLAVYGLYIIAVTAVALLVSTLCREARSALLILLGLWVTSVVALPRLSASFAEQVYPSPDSGQFWEQTQARLVANRPDAESEEYIAVEREVIERALGRPLLERELDSIDINRDALSLEVSEVIDAEVFNASFAELFDSYQQRQQFRRLISVLSPTIALQHLSHSFANTDAATHEDFGNQAETQRNTMVRIMNEDMMLNAGNEGFGYLSSSEFWSSVPEFDYQAPGISFAWRNSMIDLLVLLAWTLVSVIILFRISSRQSPIQE